MVAPARSNRLPWLVAMAAALIAVLLAIVLGGRRSAADDDADQAAVGASDEPAGFTPQGARPSLPAGADAGAAATDPALAEALPDDERGNEHPVDLERLRARIPDNLYWRLGMPTKDPQVLQMRAEEERRWNDLYGKVLSGTGTEEEVRRYYDHRRQVSADYIEFARLVLDEHGAELPEQERGLYELSIEMHTTRLAEIPRQIDEAMARKQAQDQRREEWLRGQ
jgi:hypothetical protein